MIGLKKYGFEWLIVATAAMGILVGCRSEPSAEPEIRNVIVVVVDTLRADHLGCYGYSRDTSPNLDRFADDNLLFSRVRSQASCTFPSVNSLLTSTYPYRFLNQPNGEMGIPEHTLSLAEIAAANGMATFAVTASPIMRRPATESEPHGDFGRGFDFFDEQCMRGSADCVNRQALEYLSRVRQPFLAYLHYFDPHDPYRPPRHFKRRWAGENQGPGFIQAGNPNPMELMVYRSGPPLPLNDADLDHLVDLYDEEISFFDSEFGALLGALRRRHLMENTIIVLASDHGEDFLQEHGHVKHCHSLFDATTKTPLVMSIPGVVNDGPVAAMVENVDIVPTILDYLGIDYSDIGLEGRSLRSLIEQNQAVHDFVFSLQDDLRSVDDGRFKLISELSTDGRQLYDLENDPLEQNDLFRQGDAAVADLEEALGRWRLRFEQGVDAEEALRVSDAARERLRALGYLQ